MPWSKEDRSFKTLINRATTDSTNKNFFNEFGEDTLNVHADDIWAETIPDNDPALAVTLGRAELRTLFVLTEDLTVASNQSWKAEDPVSTRIPDWISPKFGSAFEIRLFDNNDAEIFTTDPVDWFFDYQTGILTFNGNAASKARPFKVTGYRYIGLKGVSAGGVASAVSETTGNLTFNVTTTGSDTPTITRPDGITEGDFTSEPFLTIQAAINALPPIRMLGHAVRVDVGAGSFTGFDVFDGVGEVTVGGTRVLSTLATGSNTGTATSGSKRTLNLTAAGWTPSDLIGRYVNITAGTGAGQIVVIADNAAASITFADPLATIPDNTSVFNIEDVVTLLTAVEGERGDAAVAVGRNGRVILEDLKATVATTFGFIALRTNFVEINRCVAVGQTWGFLLQQVVQTHLTQVAALSNGSGGIALLSVLEGGNNVRGWLVRDSSFWGVWLEAVTQVICHGAYVINSTNASIRCINVPGIASWKDVVVDGGSEGLESQASNVEIEIGDISNATTSTFFLLQTTLLIEGLLSGTGNIGWGLDASLPGNLVDINGTTPTVTGVSGAVTVDGTTDITWANLNAPGDSASHIGTGSRLVRR